MNNRAKILTFGIAAIMLVIGIAIGSIAFPMTNTETTTQLFSITAIGSIVHPSTSTAKTVTEEVIVQQTVFGNAYAYASCTGAIGTVSFGNSTTTTITLLNQGTTASSRNGSNIEQTVTITTTSFINNFTHTQRFSVTTSSSVTQCPTFS